MLGECQEGGSSEGSIGARSAADCRGDMPDTSLRRKDVCASDREGEPNKASQVVSFFPTSCSADPSQSVTRAPIGGGVSLPKGVDKWRVGRPNNR